MSRLWLDYIVNNGKFQINVLPQFFSYNQHLESPVLSTGVQAVQKTGGPSLSAFLVSVDVLLPCVRFHLNTGDPIAWAEMARIQVWLLSYVSRGNSGSANMEDCFFHLRAW